MMTQTCEALSEVTTAELVYCIKHERAVKAETFTHGMGHLQIEEELGEVPEVYACMFPLGYAFCAPPDEPVELTLFDGDWAAQDDPEQDEEGFWFGGEE